MGVGEGILRCLVRVEFYGRVVVHVPVSEQSGLNDDEDDEGEEHNVLDEVKVHVPACRALPARIARMEVSHNVQIVSATGGCSESLLAVLPRW